MIFIVLGAEEAQAVRGPTTTGHALAPVPLADGEHFVLPAAVLDDPAHAARRAFLAALPQREVDPSEFPQTTEE
jgi:hypothetical protein